MSYVWKALLYLVQLCTNLLGPNEHFSCILPNVFFILILYIVKYSCMLRTPVNTMWNVKSSGLFYSNCSENQGSPNLYLFNFSFDVTYLICMVGR